MDGQAARPEGEILGDLFLRQGVIGATKDMTAKALGLSRQALDQRFPGKGSCLMAAAEWFGDTVWRPVNGRCQEADCTGAELLERYMIALKKVFLREPRLFIFYTECKTFFYRYSRSYQKNYTQLSDTVGCQKLTEKLIRLGQQDGSLQAYADPQEEAEYFYRAYFGFLFHMALACGDQPRQAAEQIDRYISRVVSVFRRERALPWV
jgi:AcrR family transcriptional regulator